MQQAIGKYRWTICGLLFFATTVNYLDRQVLSLLQPYLAGKFNWTNTDYANITAVFQFGVLCFQEPFFLLEKPEIFLQPLKQLLNIFLKKRDRLLLVSLIQGLM